MLVGRLACVNFWFSLNNLSLLWPTDTKFSMWVAYIKTLLGMATQVPMIMVMVNVA